MRVSWIILSTKHSRPLPRRPERNGRRLFAGLLLGALAVLPPVSGRARSQSASPVILIEQALEAYLQERYDDSIELFEQALQIDRKSETARQGLESARKQRKLKREREEAKERPAFDTAERAMSRGDYPEAMDKLRNILERVPDNPKAKSLVKRMRAKAEKQFGKSKFQSSDWFYNKGVLAYLDGDWFQAQQAWEQVYTFDPDRVSLLSKIDLAKKNLVEQQHLERIALFQNVAWDNLKQSNYEEAIKGWNEVLKLDASNAEAQEGIKQAQEAASKDIVKRRAEEIQKLSQKAMDFYIDREYVKSMELWKSVLEQDPDNAMAQDYMKRIKSREQMSSSAYRTPIPDNLAAPSSYTPAPVVNGYQRGLNYLREERYPEAIEALERYAIRNPDDAKAKETLQEARNKQNALAEKSYKAGLVAYSQGKPAEAIKEWQATLRINPDYQKARQALIKTLAESKRR